MRKQAWRSYIASLHPRYIRKAYDNGSLFWVFYWLVIYPVIMGLANDNMSEFYDLMARMFIRLIPFMIMGWSNLNSKFLMTKMMYLSPMKEQEREEYINQVLLIKIGMSVFLGVCIEAIFAIFAGFHIGKNSCHDCGESFYWNCILYFIRNTWENGSQNSHNRKG